jgi:hypothetical protein
MTDLIPLWPSWVYNEGEYNKRCKKSQSERRRIDIRFKGVRIISGLLALCAGAVYLFLSDTGGILENLFGASGPLTYERLSYDAYAVTGYDGTDSTVVIPSEHDGLPVTEIAAKAFAFNYTIRHVEVPSSVVIIHDDAFAHSTLESITLHDGIRFIGTGAFRGANITTIDLPDGLRDIKPYTFYQTNLTTITIPEDVVKIGENAFGWCTDLVAVTLPTDLDDIGLLAFAGNTSLLTLSIPAGTTYVSRNAFSASSQLTVHVPHASAPPGWEIGWDAGVYAVVYGE